MADLLEDEEPSHASLLLDYLKEFCEQEFKEFKWHLSQKVLKGFPPIPRGQVTKLDKMDLVDVMVNTYCDEGALKISLKILKKMNQYGLAQRLERDLQKLCPMLTMGCPEPSEMLPPSTVLTKGLSEPPLSFAVPPKELPLLRQPYPSRMAPIAGDGDHEGPETGNRTMHVGYSGEPSASLQYGCMLCKGPLKDLVSIPCGHLFCRQCISSYWDQSGPSGAYACPRCRKRSRTRPALYVHTELAGLVQDLQQEGCGPALPAYGVARPREVAFEDYTGGYQRLSQSSLNYQAAGTQLPYTQITAQGHTLLETTGNQLPRLCLLHHGPAEGFCNTDQMPVCRLCTEQEHQGHDIVCAETKQAWARVPTTSDTLSLLVHTLEKLAEEEFQQFKRTLRKDFPEYLGGSMEDYDIVGIVHKMLECCGREGALKITLHVLGKFNQDSHAKSGKEQNIQETMKMKMKKRFECIFEVIAKQGSTIFLNDIFTELYITEGGSGGVNNEHEVRQIESTSKRQAGQETPIKCNDIFKPLPGQRKDIRAVLTKGIAGIGKTVSVQKFVLDWAEGKANQDLNFIFPLPFRDLNVLRGRKYSLMQLLHQYFPEMKEIENIESTKFKVLFIFDGFDECRIPMDFRNCDVWCDVTESTSVEVLLTNLIKGNLLPTALLWITSRPAAAGQIPSDCIQQLTEVRGFNDPQKEEFFLKRFRDQTLAHKIIEHIKTSKSLHIMCHIPVFCWISATVLEKLLVEADSGDIPKTLTQMYTHFLLIQINIKNQKYQGTSEKNAKKLSESDKEIILKLGELAFQQLEKGNLIFYGDDLKECGIDVSEASVHSGVCTEIFKEEFGLYQEKVYCFVHLSIQEFLAALYVFYLCTQENKNALDPECVWNEQQDSEDMESGGEELNPTEMETDQEALDSDYMNEDEEYLSGEEEGYSEDCVYYIGDDDEAEVPFSTPLSDLHTGAVDKALQSENGHLDLFLRFLLGISLDSNQALLKDLLKPISNSTQSAEVTAAYIKDKIREESSPERTINLFHCLIELNDNSLVEEMKTALSSGMLKDKVLEPHQCSALAYVLLMSDDVLDEFDLKIYNTQDLGHERLVPVVKSCRRAILDSCNLIQESCKIIASALTTNTSHLQELDLSYNNYVEDSGVRLLCSGLTSPHCKLKRLALAGCQITEGSCDALASALRSKSSHLTELDLSHNHVGDSGLRLLLAGLKSLTCKLEKLLLGRCNLSEHCCKDLASVLRLHHTELRELELRDNDLIDSGVRVLSTGLEDPSCKLQRLGLSGCQVTEGGCISLALALSSNSSQLRELDLTYNHLGESAVRLLSAGLADPNRNLEKLLVDHGGEFRIKHGLQKYACHLELDPNTANRQISLSEGNRKATGGTEEQPYPDHPERFEAEGQVLCRESLSGRSYWEAEWSGSVGIGVAYKGTSREDMDTRFGTNDKSWCLECSGKDLTLYHNEKITSVRSPPVGFQRVGVYLDWPAGILSFYGISSETVNHLQTLHTTFTESLYPGFLVRSGSCVSLCILG
ncbi:NACHT, LRR and PYD domains-containing protein 3-like isoform X3 [Megalops cyprinoides]|uniref:NACHT, LRR and PYD domains-containing protein 3-like isoform X3 n=1 Tax=Megalops cyprinoides TaxID=118141 RepID=UPI0018643AAC|nr:NACHT, LRR and PYD domains-containing protein 3-like isoform X3 [Megalops cyprinoides]